MSVQPLRTLFARLLADRGGNILYLTAGGMMTMLFAVGFVLDYSRAEMMQTRLNVAADGAVLVAVDPGEINLSDASAQAAAQQMFDGQAAALSGQGVTIVSRTVTATTVSKTDSSGANSLVRTSAVNFTATVKTLFSSVLGTTKLTITGSSTSQAITPPNVDFYVVMDASPSMLLPSTATGIANLYNATGCAFACHTQNPHSNSIYVRDNSSRDIFLNANYYGTGTGAGKWYAYDSRSKTVYGSTGSQVGVAGSASISGNVLSYLSQRRGSTTSVSGYYADTYWLAHNYGTLNAGQSAIQMRVSDETTAAQNLIPYAQTRATDLKVTYRMMFATFNYTPSGGSSPFRSYGSLADVASLSTSNVPDVDGTQDYWYKNSCPTSSYCISDQASEFYNMLAQANAYMPAPGTGAKSSTPQETLMLITDGMSDESSNGGRTHSPLTADTLALCTAIKARGIRISILYTKYLPESISYESWSIQNVLPYLTPTDQVYTALRSCASSNSDGTALIYTVTTGQSISDALKALFNMTLKTAHLTQ